MKKIFAAFSALLIFSACQHDNKSYKSENTAHTEQLDKRMADGNIGFSADSTKEPTPDPPGQQPEKKQPVTKQPAPNPDWDKKIIKTASLNLEVKDYQVYSTSFREKVKSLGGYVSQEEQNQSDYKIENSLVIKVPVDQFDNAVILLSANAEKINEKKISSEDVTTEYVDTRSRMEAKKQVRDRYIDLLKQAKNMDEILSVQSEINSIQEEIEAAAGRIEYLGHSAVFSTINLTYYQVLNSSAKDTDNPSFLTKTKHAFKEGMNWIGDLFLALISIWPLLLMIIPAYMLIKKTRASIQKKEKVVKTE